MLEIAELSVAYGGLVALDGVSLSVGAGEFVSVIGPNGAGKTTLFKAISGAVPVRGGQAAFLGRDLFGVRPCDRPHLGIAHVPEGRQVFGTLTVLENLHLGSRTQAGQRNWVRNLDLIQSLFPVLAQRRGQLAGSLSGGEQQMLAIGRGLASSPRLLMLDEPSMGLAPAVADTIFERIGQIHRETGVAVLLVEQRVGEALETCDRGYVFESGRVVAQGTYESITSNDRIRRAYLGL